MPDLPNFDNFERYQRGEPLTPELAALREGRDEEAQTEELQTSTPRRRDDPKRELTKQERNDLRELVNLPGYAVLQRLHEKVFQMSHEDAINRSQVDPLKNRDEIGNLWAYSQMVKRAFGAAETMVQQELMKDTPKPRRKKQ
jgi:hypothetical protein